MTHDSSGKSIAKDDTKLADPKVFMEAMMSEMRRVRWRWSRFTNG
jgi:hypothetical protein